MEALARRLFIEHINALESAFAQMTSHGGIEQEDVGPIVTRLRTMGLVRFGRLRAKWLLHRHEYHRAAGDADAMALVADLLLGLTMICRLTAAELILQEDGVIELHQGGRPVAAYLLASGRGHKTRAALEPDLIARASQHRVRPIVPVGAIVGAVLPSPAMALPEDVVRGEITDDLVSGPSKLRIFDISELRADHGRAMQVVQ
jgi:hypothetical protein